MMPMGQTIMLWTLPKKYRGVGMGMIGLVMGFAPAVGPVIAGFVIDAFNWHMLFYGITPLAILTIVVAYFIWKTWVKPLIQSWISLLLSCLL